MITKYLKDSYLIEIGFRYNKNGNVIKEKVYNLVNLNINSLKGLDNSFNTGLMLSSNNLKNLEGLPENFNASIFLYGNPIEILNGLNNVLDPKKKNYRVRRKINYF